MPVRQKSFLFLISASAGFLLSAAEFRFPAEKTVIVRGADISAELAVREFNDIASKSTSKTIRVGKASDAPKCIFIGRSPEAEQRLGKHLLDSLCDEESLVTSRGNDLFLVGGGALGSLYAVYDFMEDNLGYRWLLNREDGQKIDKKAEVTYSGKETRRKPAFTGYRRGNWRLNKLFKLRHRDNTVAEQFIKGYRYRFAHRIPGHGFSYFLPANDPNPRYGWRPKGIKGNFREHPEYFSLNGQGKRDPNMQLCLSNPATKKALTEALLLWYDVRGAGIYMIGSNDNHNTRYCCCEGCIALEKKYNSVGGPLWDYILELCADLKKRGIRDLYVTSLAYKGPKQTERAPKNVVFPDNFICDAAFLNSDRTLKEVKDEVLEDGTDFSRYKNLQKWVSITKHVSYWYYGGSNPAEVYARMSREIKELRDAGVKSVFACGTGGGYEFGDMTDHLFYTLLRNPDADARAVIKEALDFKYGPAADIILRYIDELDASRQKAIAAIPYLLGTDRVYDNFSFLSGKELVRWQKLLDKAEKAVAGKEPYARNVRFARIGLDLFSLVYANKIRRECPEYPLDLAKCEARGRAAAEEYGRLYLENRRNEALDSFNQMANFANLKSDALPPELAKYPKDKVTRFLPPKSRVWYGGDGRMTNKLISEPDKDSVCGFAWSDIIPDKMDYTENGVGIDFYDTANRKWVIRPVDVSIPLSFFEKGKYRMFRIGKVPISKSCRLIFGGLWNSPANIKTLGNLFDPTYVAREYEIWVSIKAEGNKFFPDDNRPGKLYIEQIFAVDMGMPEGK